MFKVAQTKDKGKKSFACAMGLRCLSRCPRLVAKINCQVRRGLCVGNCGGVIEKKSNEELKQ